MANSQKNGNDDLGTSDSPSVDDILKSVGGGVDGETEEDSEVEDDDAEDSSAPAEPVVNKDMGRPTGKPMGKKPPATKPVEKVAVAKVVSDRVVIVLDDPGSGNVSQFIGLNGVGFQIKFNEEVEVPRALLNVLDELITTRSIPLDEGGIVERSHKRFPYRIIR